MSQFNQHHLTFKLMICLAVYHFMLHHNTCTHFLHETRYLQ